MIKSKIIYTIIALSSILILNHCTHFHGTKTLSDEPEQQELTQNVIEYPSYSQAIENWNSVQDVTNWMGHNFSYDFDRAVELSETCRENNTVGVYSPAELFSKKRGVCVDLSRFAIETVRIISMELNPKYIMIEFTPINIRGKVIRMHWLASYKYDGKCYFFADTKRPGYISGPFNSTKDFMTQYEKYRGRKIVSFQELDSFKKKRLKKKKMKQRF